MALLEAKLGYISVESLYNIYDMMNQRRRYFTGLRKTLVWGLI